jgi:O-antigen/teichoic acid export membrane protein
MGTDYYPRLSGVAYDNAKAKETINQQAEISILILAPILMVFLVFINWVVILLYSAKFTEVSGMIHWAALGMFFKAPSWAIAFILLAKGASKLFFWNELIANIYILLLNIVGYKFWGLEGLGISFLAGYFAYFIQVYILAKIKYFFTFKKAFYKLFIIQFLLGLFCFLTAKNINAPLSYIIGTIFIAISTILSLKELDKRININQYLRNLKYKNG